MGKPMEFHACLFHQPEVFFHQPVGFQRSQPWIIDHPIPARYLNGFTVQQELSIFHLHLPNPDMCLKRIGSRNNLYVVQRWLVDAPEFNIGGFKAGFGFEPCCLVGPNRRRGLLPG